MTGARKPTALGTMQGILLLLEARNKRPTAELLDQIKQLTSDAITVLREPDPDKQKIGFILLAIQQSTDVKVITSGKKRVTRVTILDHTIYNWALEEIHALAMAR